MDKSKTKSLEITVHTVSEYIQKVLGTPLEDNFIERNAYYFRGQMDAQWELTPSLARIAHYDVDSDLERELVERTKNELPDVFADPDLSPVELLSLLQHSGVPTRLLDITENPLVALYFALVCSDGELDTSVDGEVIQFMDKWSTECVTTWENAIADSCHLIDGNYDLVSFAKSALEKSYFNGHKSNLEGASDKKLKDIVKTQCSKPIFIKSKAHLDRQLSQRGHYILFPNAIDSKSEKYRQDMVSFSKDDSCVYCRYIIPKDCKSDMLRDLDRLGINESTLYPDSIDHICKHLTRKTKRAHILPNSRKISTSGSNGPVTAIIYGEQR